ncbi:MAG: hypothetical protein Q4G64_02415 [bacterium]|nr:hypothetical protein [bacterium]
MLDILVRALVLVAIIGIGLLAKRLRWASTSDFPLFSKLVLYVTLPCAVAAAFNDMDITTALLLVTLIAVGVNLFQIVTSYLATMRASRSDQSLAVLNLTGFNIGAFATPYISGMMGGPAVVYTSMFDIGNAFGYAGVGYSAGMALAENRRPSVFSFLGRMFRNPVFNTYLALLLMRLADLRFPAPVLEFVTTVGAANPFMAMLMVGIGLQVRMPRAKAGVAFRLLAVRYAVSIALAVAIWFLLPLPEMARAVMCMLLFAPIGSQSPVLTAEARGDVQLSTFMVTVSIVVGIVAMPLILVGLTA